MCSTIVVFKLKLIKFNNLSFVLYWLASMCNIEYFQCFGLDYM
jgi:hypothetical protein